MHIIGQMSGTSLDGLDLVFAKTDGQQQCIQTASLFIPYPASLRQQLQKITQFALSIPNTELTTHYHTHNNIIQAEQTFTQFCIEQISGFIQKIGITPDMIGFHGQTLLHRPEKQISWQIGDLSMIANYFNLSVCGQLRLADLKSQGQGAPLTPVFHQMLIKQAGLLQNDNSYAIVNIGGVANMTWCQKEQIIALDTGPGNSLIDILCEQHFNCLYDKSGKLAQQGHINIHRLSVLLGEPWFELPAPKSLDRHAFSIDAFADLKPLDALATTTAFTAASIIKACQMMPSMPSVIYITGGGSKNDYLLQLLQDQQFFAVHSIEEIKGDSDFLEATAMAYIAARTYHNLPSSWPETTGCQSACIAGEIIQPSR